MVIKLHKQERQRGKNWYIRIYKAVRLMCMTLSYDYMPEVI